MWKSFVCQIRPKGCNSHKGSHCVVMSEKENKTGNDITDCVSVSICKLKVKQYQII